MKDGDGAAGEGHAPEEVDDELAEDLPALHAVVKVFTTHSDPDYCLPWQKQPQLRSSGTGFVISGRPGTDERFVLTNAHCIEHWTQVQLKRRGDDAKFAAKVLAVGWHCDLALLAVEDPTFFDGDVEPVPFSQSLPRLEDPVMCAGYPVGGETLSVTSGVVSRIEVTEYTQCRTDLLGIQIDAAINSGNSGGPALNQRGQCVGVAFQGLEYTEAENIGYIIPVPVVNHFLQDVAVSGQYRGFPTLGLSVQNMENKALRAAHQMEPKERGVLVRAVDKTSCCHEKVKPGDVLLSFDGQSIGYDGTVPLRKHERVSFSWSVGQRFVGDSAELSILRDGERQSVQVSLTVPYNVIPQYLPSGQTRPSYFIVGGIVFTPLSSGYLSQEYGDEWRKEAPLMLAFPASFAKPDKRDEELVVIAQILAHELTVGYEKMEHRIVEKACGEEVDCLLTLCRIVRNHKGDTIRFDLRDSGGVIVIPAEAAKAAMPALLDEHCVSSEISEDMLQKLQEEEKGAAAASSEEAPAAASPE